MRQTKRLLLPVLAALLCSLLPAARVAQANTYTVSTSADSGAGSLRQAITNANSNPGPDTITFNLPNGTIITVIAPLPALSGGETTIDATKGTGRPQIVLTTAAGAADQYGINITSNGNLVRGLVINGFSGSDSPGLAISGTVSGNTIELNYIGTDLNAANASPNGYGVALHLGASGNTVQDNVLAGNSAANLFIGPVVSTTVFGSPVNGRNQANNIVRRNKIGTNAAGDAKLSGASTQIGVDIYNNSNSNQIGPGNVIAGNGTSGSTKYGGVRIDGNELGVDVPSPAAPPNGNLVLGNRIGTNDAGTAAVPNTGNGVFIGASIGTTIGGSSPSDANQRNVIAGNAGPGVQVQETWFTGKILSAIVIRNNRIGIDAAGTTALPNTGSTGYGVFIHTAASNVTVGPGNTISGNTLDGVYIRGVPWNGSGAQPDQTTNNTISANQIGTDAAGASGVGNQRNGIQIRGGTSGNSIDGNRVAGNKNNGIVLDQQSPGPGTDTKLVPTANTIRNNTIGVLSTNQAIGNHINTTGDDGVLIYAGSGNTVGPGNTIAGHQRSGVAIDGGFAAPPDKPSPTNNTIKGNLLGKTGAISTGNYHGVYLTSGVAGNTIGGAGSGACASAPSGDCNLLAGNIRNGVLIDNTSANNSVLGNRAQNNGEAGVQVTDSGSVGNRILRTTTSTNGSLNPGLYGGITLLVNGNNFGPASVSSATAAVNGQSVSGTVDCPGGNCTVQVFGDDTAQPQDEGPSYLGEQTGVTSAFSITLTPCAKFLIFTVTDGSGNTSEFQNPLGNPGCTPAAPAAASLSNPSPSSAQSGPAGGSVTYNFTLTNSGGSSGQFGVNLSSAAGWIATIGTPNPLPATLAVGESVSLSVVVQIPAGATPPASGVTTVTPVVNGTAQAAAAKSVTTSVAAGAAPLLRAANAENLNKSGNPGATVSYNLVLQNTGGTAGSFSLALSPGTPLPAGWSSNIGAIGPFTIGGGGSQSFIFQVTIAAGALVGPATPLTLVASVAGAPSSSLTTNTSVNLVPVAPTFSRSSPATLPAGPGEAVDVVFQLINNANGPDSFTFAVAGLPAGWTAQVLPANPLTNVARGAPGSSVTVRVTPPASPAPSAGNYPFTVTACSATNPKPCAPAAGATISIVTAAVPQISAAAAGTTNPGQAFSFNHTLTNIGNAAGTFNLTIEGLPANWTGAITPQTAFTLNAGASTSFQATITPPPGARAGAYQVTIRATATDANAATTTRVDLLNVAKTPSLALTPPTQTSSQPPNSIYTATVTLRNNGNFSDTIQLSATPSAAGWRARAIPSSITLDAGAQIDIKIEIVIPAGQDTSVVDTTTVTASYSSLAAGTPGRSAQATITTTIVAVAGLQLAPALNAQLGKAGVAVDYTFTLTNSGSIAQSYNLALSGVPANPPGWQALISSPGATVGPLNPGERATITVRLTAPQGTPEGTPFDITLTATSQQLTQPAASAVARLTIGAPYGVIITPDNQRSVLPGSVVRYQHTVRNSGLLTDTFILRAGSGLGWETPPVAPASLTLGPGASQLIEVTLLVPTSAEADVEDLLVVTAQSAGNPALTASATNTTTIRQVPEVGIAPDRNVLLDPGRELTFNHTVTNTGNGADSFTISYTQDLRWQVTLLITATPPLGRGASYPVRLKVKIPANADRRFANRIRITARSTSSPAVFAQVTDTIVATEPNIVLTPRAYLPGVQR